MELRRKLSRLLNELELDAPRTVVQLEELQLENRPGSGRRDTVMSIYNYLMLETPCDVITIQF